MADKPKTTDEYVLAELEKYKSLSSKLKAENADLQAELDKKVPIPSTPTVVESPYVCYGFEVLQDYNIENLDNQLNSKQIQELLDDDTAFRTWAACATYTKYGDKIPVLNVSRREYTVEINYLGTLIGVYIWIYSYDKQVNTTDYVIDNKHYFKDYDQCKEAALQKLKAELTDALKRVKAKEDEAAAKAAEAKSEAEPEPENK